MFRVDISIGTTFKRDTLFLPKWLKMNKVRMEMSWEVTGELSIGAPSDAMTHREPKKTGPQNSRFKLRSNGRRLRKKLRNDKSTVFRLTQLATS